jgi:hypothetical protein
MWISEKKEFVAGKRTRYFSPYWTEMRCDNLAETRADKCHGSGDCMWSLVVGTSISLGWGATACKGHMQMLQADYAESLQPVQFGSPGRATSFLRKYLEAEGSIWNFAREGINPSKYKSYPETVLFGLSIGNDVGEAQPTEAHATTFRQNMEWWIDLFATSGTRCIIWGGIVPVFTLSAEYLHALDDAARADVQALQASYGDGLVLGYAQYMNIVGAEEIGIEEGQTGHIRAEHTVDGRHPLDEAHKIMATQVKTILSQCPQ